MAGYYKKFIRGCATIASPRTDLLKKDNFACSSTTQSAFDNLKPAITNAPVLPLPNFVKPFILETDALGAKTGAILGQEGHPIGFFHKKISNWMQKTISLL